MSLLPDLNSAGCQLSSLLQDYSAAPVEYPTLDVQVEAPPGNVSNLHTLRKLQWLQLQQRKLQARQGAEQHPVPITNSQV